MDRKLYHAGFREKVSRSIFATFANANETQDWRIYRDFAQMLILIFQNLYAGDDLRSSLKRPSSSLNASTIHPCLSSFPMGQFP